jgi:hypothetical protein
MNCQEWSSTSRNTIEDNIEEGISGVKGVNSVKIVGSPCSARYLPRSGGIRFRSAGGLAPAVGAVSTDFEPRHEDVKVAIPL